MDGTGLRETPEAAWLSPYQADAYVALLDHGSASASDLAVASGVLQPRIYDVLGGWRTRATSPPATATGFAPAPTTPKPLSRGCESLSNLRGRHRGDRNTPPGGDGGGV